MTDIITRSIEEITASARMNMQDMINRAIALGKDFIDAKEALGHGKFLPWLEKLGVSSSTAANYMKVAREIEPDSKLATLPYSKALALLAAPAEDREALAAEAEDKSASEIRRLIEERNKAAEAANVETNRADGLQKEVHNLEVQNKSLLRDYEQLTTEVRLRKEAAAKLNEELKAARAQTQTVEVEKVVAPADYQTLKDSQQMLLDAAAEAEARAADAEARLEEAMANAANGVKASSYEVLHKAMKIFFIDCEMLPFAARDLANNVNKIYDDVHRLKNWADAMEKALESAQIIAEGGVQVV